MNLNQKQTLNFPPMQPSSSNTNMVKTTGETTSEPKESSYSWEHLQLGTPSNDNNKVIISTTTSSLNGK